MINLTDDSIGRIVDKMFVIVIADKELCVGYRWDIVNVWDFVGNGRLRLYHLARIARLINSFFLS